jgi:hypothetical protein
VTEHVLNSVVTPSDAPVLVRQSLGVAADAPLRTAYVAGPGDACGTFDYWARGLHDPRTPVVAYSSMFYSVVASIDATSNPPAAIRAFNLSTRRTDGVVGVLGTGSMNLRSRPPSFRICVISGLM